MQYNAEERAHLNRDLCSRLAERLWINHLIWVLVYIYIYIYTHTHTHTHIHIYDGRQLQRKIISVDISTNF